jgi:histidinol-phosphate/aromatic aminotransferase/cobyric acid decarboxylase-like protein/CTP:molybdopterin cytidylyltransferase MocA
MKAIILTAGYGRRMRPLSNQTHKTLLNVAGRTIIERIIDGLVDNGITDIAIVTGYRKDQLTAFLTSNFPDVRFTFVHNARYDETNNIYSLALAFEELEVDDDVVLIESDLVYEPSVIRRLLDSPRENVALVDRFQRGMDGTVVTLQGDVISNVIPPHLQGMDFDFSDKFKTLNIYKFSKEFCNTVFKQLLTYYAKVIDDNCYYELILGILIYMQRETIHAALIEGEEWAEVDDPNDLRVAEFKFNREERRQILESTFGAYWNHDVTDFCFIRNMYFPDGSMISQLRSDLEGLLHNYGSKQDVLKEKLGYHLLVDPNRLHVLNGASECFPILRARFEGKSGLIPSPTFGEYERLFVDTHTYGDDVGIDPEQIEIRADSRDVVVFVNPNNPTGSVVPTGWIYDFAARHPEKTIVVDESFIDFTDHPSIIGRLEEEPLENVIVLKSLSKCLGVPGIRLGYAYTCSEATNAFVRDRLPIWNLNSLAEHFLEVILKHRSSLDESFRLTIRDREAFSEMLRRTDCVDEVHPSGANFLLLTLAPDIDAEALVDHLLSERDTFVKDVSSKFAGERHLLRLAVRLPQENTRLAEAFQDYATRTRVQNRIEDGAGNAPSESLMGGSNEHE